MLWLAYLEPYNDQPQSLQGLRDSTSPEQMLWVRIQWKVKGQYPDNFEALRISYPAPPRDVPSLKNTADTCILRERYVNSPHVSLHSHGVCYFYVDTFLYIYNMCLFMHHFKTSTRVLNTNASGFFEEMGFWRAGE